MKFAELGLAETLLRAVVAQGYSEPTAIQAAAIPAVLEGRDVLGCAQTGTGKTAAFALPTLQRLTAAPAAARKVPPPPHPHLGIGPHAGTGHAQIGESFRSYGRFTGLRGRRLWRRGPEPAGRALQAGVEILVATPGRLLDLMQQGFVDLSAVEVLILDEADRMLDMGFLPDLKRIVARCPPGGRRSSFRPRCPRPSPIGRPLVCATRWTCGVGPTSATIENHPAIGVFRGPEAKARPADASAEGRRR